VSDYSADATTWLQWADQTYAGASILFNPDNPFLWFSAACLGHQALEMYIKSALIRRGRRVVKGDVWGHDLVGLAGELAKSGAVFPYGLISSLQDFNDFFEELRYPHPVVKVQDLGATEVGRLRALVAILRPLAL
jgi:HEPN domain-containing protein